MFEKWEDGEYRYIAKCILHELCHLFLEPVERLFMWDVCPSQRQYAVDTLERQVQRIANAIFNALPEGWFLPEKLLPATSLPSEQERMS